ncbi:MAG: ABC transporter ATP-binding protein [Ruminococcus sp.]|nr:ABC transporter ATP-binding protein [Ruminococcus sp.]
MIEVQNLTKKYGQKAAVNDISFTVNDGEILGFLGPNGAGKSTTMNILTGYISSTEGKALINGIDILEEPLKAKKFIGYLPENPPLYIDMTVKDYLDFIYRLKKCKLPKKAHIEEVCRLAKITEVYNRIIKNLSKGYKQRVGVAQALIGNPPILILDEPTVGLDPKQIIEIRTLIKKLGKRHTVILSSHILSEIQSTCDRVIIINNGEIAADGNMEDLTSAITGEKRLIARIEGDRDEIIKVIGGIKGVDGVRADTEREKGAFDYEIEVKDDIRKELVKRITARNWNLLALRFDELTLEDIFLMITMGDDKAIEKLDKLKQGTVSEEKKTQLKSAANVALASLLGGAKKAEAPEADKADENIESEEESK